MKIIVLGCGNAFSGHNFNQSFLVEESLPHFSGNGSMVAETRRMLIDCGRRVPEALDAAGISMESIDDIYISHLHSDHVGGLEHLAFVRYDWKNRPESFRESQEKGWPSPPRLIANRELMKELWLKTLRGGLESMEGFLATLETYFIPVRVAENKSFDWMGWRCSLIQQIHIMTGSSIMNTFGLFMEREGYPSVYFTTDSQHCSPRQLEIFYRKADLIFQDCELSPHMSQVHANWRQLTGDPTANSIRLGPEIRRKMLLSHYQDYYNEGRDADGSPFDWDRAAAEHGFIGFARVGMEVDILPGTITYGRNAGHLIPIMPAEKTMSENDPIEG